MNRYWVLAAVLVCAFSWRPGPAAWADEAYPVPPPPLSEDYYPCAENCHNDLETNPEKRELVEEHDNIRLHHAEQFRWCLDCHDAKNRDKLHLQSGEKIDFAESYRLCGQCHGDKYRDWKRGVHGKRTGSWNGRKQYLLCAHCHNPHNPRFRPLEPMPAPKVPGSGTLEHVAKVISRIEREAHGEAAEAHGERGGPGAEGEAKAADGEGKGH
ncbi:MAG: hypothetical protein Kow0092_01600 [Deferrisomatales bacterium]